MLGEISQPDTLIISENARNDFLRNRTNLSDILRGELAQRTWLFIGFDASETWIRNFFDNTIHSLDRHNRRTYIMGDIKSDYIKAWWENRNMGDFA